MVPFPGRKRNSPNVAMNPEENVPAFPFSPSSTRGKSILETSPQRRAFSKILQMLNAANVSRIDLEKQNERIIPKFLKLLKQAKREKEQLQEQFDLAVMKARRDILSSNKYWGEKVMDLNREHVTTLKEYEDIIASKGEECHNLKSRIEELVMEVASVVKKQMIYLKEGGPVQDHELLLELENATTSIDTSRVLQLLEEQSALCHAMLQKGRRENVELRASFEDQIQTLREEKAHGMDMTHRRMNHDSEPFHTVHHPQKNLPKTGGAEEVLLPSSSSDLYEDCIMQNHDDDDNDPPVMEDISSASNSCDSTPAMRGGKPLVSRSVVGSLVPMFDHDNLQKKVEDLQRRFDEAQRNNSILEQSNDHLKAQLESTEIEAKELRQQIELSNQNMDNEYQARQKLQAVYESLRQEQNELASTATKELLEKEQVVAEVTLELRKCTAALATVESEKNTLGQALTQLENDHVTQLYMVRAQHEIVERRLESVSIGHKQIETALREELKSTRGNLCRAEMTIEEMETRNGKINSNLQQQIASNSRELAVAREAITDLTSEVVRLERKLEVEELRSDLEISKLKNQNDEQVSVIKKELSEVQDERTELTERLQQMENNHTTTLQERDDSFQQRVTVALNEKVRFEQEATRLNLLLRMAKEEVSDLSTQIDTAKAQHDEGVSAIKQELSQVNDERTELAARLQQMEDDHAATLQHLDDSYKEKVTAALDERLQCEQEAARLNELLCRAMEEVSSLETKIETENAQHHELVSELKSERTDLTERLQQIETDHTTTLQHLHDSYQEKVTAAQKESTSLNDLLCHTREEVATLQVQIDAGKTQHDEEVAAIQSELSQLIDERTKLTDRLQQMENDHITIVQQLDDSRQQKVTAALDEKVRCEQEAAKLNALLCETRDEMASLESNIVNDKAQNDEQVSIINRELSQVKDERNELTERLQQMERDHTKTLQHLEDGYQEKVGTALKETTRLDDLLRQAREEVARLEAQIDVIQTQHLATSKKLEEATTDYAEKLREHDNLVAHMEECSADELYLLEAEYNRLMQEKDIEMKSLQQLCDDLEEENKCLFEEFEVQQLWDTTANEAEVSVLKQYVQELEQSLEDHRRALAAAYARHDELIDEVDQLREPIESLPLSTQNNSHLFSPGVDPSREDEILELRRGLFAADTFVETTKGEFRRRADDSSVLLDHSTVVEESPPREGELIPFRSPEESHIAFNESLNLSDWQERCLFIENDRDHVMRIADGIIEEERAAHVWQLEAAVATVKREAAEHLLEQQLYTRRQITILYDGLCEKCRRKIDSA